MHPYLTNLKKIIEVARRIMCIFGSSRLYHSGNVFDLEDNNHKYLNNLHKIQKVFNNSK